jgi:hypothetical protein
MQSQNLDANVLAEPVDPQAVPAQCADGALSPSDSTTEESNLDDLLNDQPVPPRRVVTISVQYRHLGRGRALPYQLEDDAE